MSKDNWILSSTVNFNSIVSKIEFIQDWVKTKIILEKQLGIINSNTNKKYGLLIPYK